MLLIAASSVVDVDALWKIALASATGGIGVVIAFGLVLLGLSRADAQRGRGTLARGGYLTLAALAGLFCLVAVCVGVWAMTKKS